jgi:hypothetical protein
LCPLERANLCQSSDIYNTLEINTTDNGSAEDGHTIETCSEMKYENSCVDGNPSTLTYQMLPATLSHGHKAAEVPC